MKSIEEIISEGKEKYNNQKYEDALVIFEQLWSESESINSTILGYLGLCLRKSNRSEEFVDICRDLNADTKLFRNRFISSTLCWCIYDAHIKTYDASDTENFKEFLKRSTYITNELKQLSRDKFYLNPYGLTIIKVVKVYRDKPSTNWDAIINWLDKLNQHELPNEVFEFDDNGKKRELASYKEFFYQYYTKGLEKRERFKECITYCEEALENIDKFHYRNQLWFKARMHYCLCMISKDIDDDIVEYKKIAATENYWYMYHKLAQIYLRYNDIKNSLLYASKAIETKFEYEKMVNLLFDIAQLWDAKGERKKSIVYYQASAYYRERQGWYHPEELRFAIENFEINIDEKPNIRMIQDISKQYIQEIEGIDKISGSVLKILENGKVGFLTQNGSKNNVYFRLADVDLSEGLKKGDKVKFDVILEKDGRTRAINIEKEI
ncbi:hypothetical protein QE109_11975 [Fusibacter bizertensis]|uniref:Cold shock domain-containing protein n=1 Tax=Fusibacter bizertensis TaxID=1488331 RepID=A0ABT6NEK5_9FIRM|nr:hypothetical protein [Fusibacter bizertensis]MDH8678873.1 hypothetical protein [Fusibacter bizertensis]